MSPSPQQTTHDRFRRFVAWYVVVLGALSTLLLASIVLSAYAFDGAIHLYVNEFREAGVEVALFGVVCGTLPFGLYVLDDYLRPAE